MMTTVGTKIGILLSLLIACLILSPDAEARKKKPPPRVVVWSQSQVDVTLSQGDRTSLTISFSPTKRLSKATLVTSEPVKPFLALGTSGYKSIKKGQVVSLPLNIEIPENASPGVYVGELALRVGRRNLADTIKINVTVMPEPTPGDHGPSSEGTVSLSGSSELSFNQSDSDVDFVISGAMFGEVAALYHNGEFVDASRYSVEPTRLLAKQLLVDGRNELILYASDHLGRNVHEEFVLWAGRNSLSGQLVDENGSIVDGATVTARLGDDQSVVEMAQVVGGAFSFSRLPARTIILEAVADGNRFTSTAVSGIDGSVTLKLSAIEPASQINNNDFSLGTSGWNIGSAPVSLVDHVEGATPLATSAKEVTTGKMATASNVDLVLSTSGFGEQTITRSFVVKPGTESVTVRYRFLTSEIPGGFFGTEFNDAYSVNIRAEQSGSISSDINSMNGLGRSSFDDNGATPWRELSLNTIASGDTIQVDLTVVNVKDGLYDSSIIIDIVDEKSLAITSLSLRDIDNSKLTHLSMDQHQHFNGNTIIHGAVTIEGSSDDSLTSLVLDILDQGAVIATADLSPAAASALLTPFGADGQIQKTTGVLFAFAPPPLAGGNRTLSLRARAQSSSGQMATREIGKVELLVRYKGSNRYPARPCSAANAEDCNEIEGGDAWARPSLREVAEGLSGLDVAGLVWGDFSNMNGGYIYPHKTHNVGLHVDGKFQGYYKRDAEAAETLIKILNSSYGQKILTVLVGYEEGNPADKFWLAIKDKPLIIKRIRPAEAGTHRGHFHVRLK